MFPMMLGALSIIGYAIRDPATEARVQNLILQLFPGNAQPELQSAIHGVRQSAGWFGIVSLGGILWSASGIFATMEFALTQIFGTKQRDMLRQKLMGFLMMMLLVVALGITLAANAAAGYLSNYIPYAWLLSFAIGAVVMVVLLALLYRFVPNRTFRMGEVLPGALLAGVLIEALSLGFSLYAGLAGHFNTLTALSSACSSCSRQWLYLLSQLLLLGAVYNRFRLGQPAIKGLIASPARQSRATARPVDVIKTKKKPGATKSAESDDLAEPPPASAMTHRSILQRAVLAASVGLAVAGAVIRRRRRSTLS